MERALTAWLLERGLPAWLCPDALMLVGVAGFLGGFLVLRRAMRDGAAVHEEARALALAFAAAWLGGFLFEAALKIPDVLATRSLEPLRGNGADMYAAILAGSLVPAVYLRLRRQPVLAYLDRSTLLWGVSIACARLGCFMNGCDFGFPTASFLGLRFPSGTPVAEAHAAMGWVRSGSACLPVHPTQLYEAALGLLAVFVASRWVRPSARRGSAFAAFLFTYAAGRFGIEFLRADASRALVPGLTGGQLASLAVLFALIALVALVALVPSSAASAASPSPRRARRVSSALVSGAIGLFTLSLAPNAEAQPSTPMSGSPSAETPASPSATPQRPAQYDKKFSARLTTGFAVVLGFPHLVDSGALVEVAGFRRFRLRESTRADLGLELRYYGDIDASHWKIGVPVDFAIELGRSVELPISIAPGVTFVNFDSPYFEGGAVFDVRMGVGIQFPIKSVVTLGVTPFSFDFIFMDRFGGIMITQELRAWVGAAF
jgi:prolipoprotein diacylglyceryltransferase